MYARRAHYPNMQFQLQEDLTTQKNNLLLFSSFLDLSSIMSNAPITVRPGRLGHKPQIQIPNLESLIKTLTMKFPSLPHCFAQLFILHSQLLSKHS